MKLHEKIRKLREKKGWSQGELADKLNVHPTHVSRLERNKYTPSFALLEKMVKLFEVSYDYLLNEELENFDVKIKDKSLAERIRLIDSLGKKQREALIEVIDSMLTQKRILELIANREELIKGGV